VRIILIMIFGAEQRTVRGMSAHLVVECPRPHGCGSERPEGGRPQVS